MGSKRKLRLILEYLGYKRIKTNKTGLTLYSMVKTDPFSMVPLRVNEKAAWTVLYELSDELDDFIDYVYPFPKSPKYTIDIMYDVLLSQNKINNEQI